MRLFLFRFLARLPAVVAGLGPRFWFLLVALVMIHRGASMFHPGAGWLLCGLIVAADALREETPASK